MALGPINYQMQVATPFESVLQGMTAGAKMADIEAARAQQMAQTQAAQQAAALAQAKFDREQAFETAKQAYFANPARTGADFDRLLAQAPDKQALDALKAAAESRGTERLANDKRFYGQLQMALEVNPEIAKSMLSERIAGEQNAQDRKGLEILLEGLKVSPEKALEGIEYVGGGAFGKDWVDANAKIREERRARELQPAVLAAKKREGVPASIQEAIDFANLTPGQQKTFENLIVLRRPPPAVTSVNVTNLEKTASGELAKLIPDLYQQANSAAGQLADIPRYRAALDNAIVGPLAEQRLTVARIGNALGFTGEKAINATQELIQGNAEMALRSRSMLTGQGQITEGEQKLLIRARSGDINFSKGELQTLFSVFERASKAQYEKSVNLLRSASGKSETAQMFLDNVSPMPGAPESITVGGRTYKRPENFTDQQWADYKRAVGGQR